MKQFDGKSGTFYREQTLGVTTISFSGGDRVLMKGIANLRFLFGNTVDILTCDANDNYVIAFACQTRYDGERVKIMQAYAVDIVKALKALHDMSCRRLTEFCTDCGHDLHREHLEKCRIALPVQASIPLEPKNLAVSEDSNVLVDMPLSEEDLEQGESEIHEAEHGHIEPQEESTSINMAQERCEDLTENALVSQDKFTPSTSISSQTRGKGFSILLEIQYPFKRPIGALRYIESSSRQNILRVVAQVLSTSEITDDPIWPMKSLSIRKGNTLYDVLGYPEDDIGSLLDDILESEKLIKIEIVH